MLCQKKSGEGWKKYNRITFLKIWNGFCVQEIKVAKLQQLNQLYLCYSYRQMHLGIMQSQTETTWKNIWAKVTNFTDFTFLENPLDV